MQFMSYKHHSCYFWKCTQGNVNGSGKMNSKTNAVVQEREMMLAPEWWYGDEEQLLIDSRYIL